jgi:hypothetical protein
MAREFELVSYRLTTVRPYRSDWVTEVRMFGAPRVGRPMIFYGPRGFRIVTTPVRRLLVEAESKATYVQTDNTVYQLCRPPGLP